MVPSGAGANAMTGRDGLEVILTKGDRELLARKYRLGPTIGDGGMGVVVAAYDVQLDRRVAIKFLRTEAVSVPDIVPRFLREARAAAKIESEHVVRVIEVGSLSTGAPYIVMEYLEGGDLAAWVREKGRLPVELAVDFVLQACEAVADAHRLGIIHRDLKPANLFCIQRSDGMLWIKVLDFGISKVTGLHGCTAELALTQASVAMGSPPYMSPEQLRSTRDVDSRTDIWSIGTILYELLVGTPPFRDETLSGLAIKVATEPPLRPREICPEIPPALEHVVLRCLEKDKDRRYANVAELALALGTSAPKRAKASIERICGVLQNAGLAGSTIGLPPSSNGTTPDPALQTEASWGHTAPPPGTTRTKVVLVLSVAVLLTGVLGIAVAKWPPPGGAAHPAARGLAFAVSSAVVHGLESQPASSRSGTTGAAAHEASPTPSRGMNTSRDRQGGRPMILSTPASRPAGSAGGGTRPMAAASRWIPATPVSTRRPASLLTPTPAGASGSAPTRRASRVEDTPRTGSPRTPQTRKANLGL